jgi:D-sedoheptulose 7-phosphate isomerase
MAQLDRQSIAKFADLLLDSRESGSTTFFLGNGGSASTATHFVNDISLGSRQFEKPFRAISLCDNQAVITAIANDDGYENIFLQQLQTLAKAGDTIVCISASGNSKNLIKAMEYASANNIFIVGLSAFDGGYLKKNCDLNIHIPTKVGEYGPAEDLHMVVCGLVGSYFRKKFLNA